MLHERPNNFRFNPFHQFAQGLALAALGFRGDDKSYTCTDSSLYSNDGTLTNMEPDTDWVWDKTLNRFVLSFGGTDEYVIASQLPFGYPYSMACWFNVPDVTTDYALIFAGNPAASNIYTSLSAGGAQAGDPIQATRRNTTAQAASTTTGFTADTWNHAVGIYEQALGTAYLNGGGVGTNANSVNVVATMIPNIGRLGDSTPTGYIVGKITDVMVWRRILSTSEITELADPSNVMYSGLLLPPTRRLWAVTAAPPVTTTRNLILGGGVI